jgi:hypothetical protein
MRSTSLGPKLLAISLCLSGAGMLSAQTNTHTLAKQAAFIFNGEVENARTVEKAELRLPPQSVPVRVLEVLYVKPTTAVRPGELVIVQMAERELPSAGTRATFYTNGWIYGTHLTVRELGHVVQEALQGQVKQEIAQAKAEAEDDQVRERLADAEVVLAGVVKSVKPFEEAKKASQVSEHDADWWLAEISVKRFLKGEPGKNTVLVAFPNSRDVMWADSPKFKAGEEGIWILHRPMSLERIFASVKEPVYTAINRRDFQETKEIERVMKLLKTPTK